MAVSQDVVRQEQRFDLRVVRVVSYLLYLVVTSVVVFVAGFKTVALGAVVMTLALLAFGGVRRLTKDDRSGDAQQPADSGAVDWFRPSDLWVVVLACLPAVALPAEVTSPMASFVFFMVFAIPVACVVLTRRAFTAWNHQRLAAAAGTGLAWSDAVMPPPGWYADPVDPRCVRWWDGFRWTHHWATPRR